jgi:hypothetical protein
MSTSYCVPYCNLGTPLPASMQTDASSSISKDFASFSQERAHAYFNLRIFGNP